MITRQFFLTLSVILIAFFAACISEQGNPLDSPTGITSGTLLVDTGFTTGSGSSVSGEFSAFTMRWTEVDNAQYYEIRSSEIPITLDNWYDATEMTTVQAPADSADVFVRVEVQKEPCIGCGLCEQVCEMDAISVQGGIAVIDYDLCTACGQCQDVCPVDAITGTRFGKDYFFGIRSYFAENSPGDEITVSDQSRRLIYFNYHRDLDPSDPSSSYSCNQCLNTPDSLGFYRGCFIIGHYIDYERTEFTGLGCPVDAIWQDTVQAGSINQMIYIDYDNCINCGQCFSECWEFGVRSLQKYVVSPNWVSSYPDKP